MLTVRKTDRHIGGGIYLGASCLFNRRYRNKALDVAKTVNRSINLFRQYLDIPPDIFIRIAPIKGAANGRYCHSTRMVEIDCTLRQDTALEVLAHELVHAEQYHTGRLKQHFESTLGWLHSWNGDKIFNKGTTYQAYINQPWEKEAFGREKELAKKVKMDMDKIYE